MLYAMKNLPACSRPAGLCAANSYANLPRLAAGATGGLRRPEACPCIARFTACLSRNFPAARAEGVGGARRGAVASPAIVSNALSSSGELNIINWDDELPDPVIPNFEKATGIKVNSTPFSQNEEQINKLQATGGEGFDVCQPTHDRAPQFKDIDVLQPIDIASFDPTGVIVPGLLAASTKNWTWDGKLYHVPHVWGTEAIAWRNDLTKIDPAELSFGTLWNDEYKGKVQGRRIRCCSASASGWTARASCRPTACSTPSRTRRR